MNNNLKLMFILIFCLVVTGCATNNPLNRELVHQETIKTVNLNLLTENVSIELSSSGSAGGAAAGGLLGALVGAAVDSGINSSRNAAFDVIQEKSDDMSANAVLQNALEHSLEGKAFSEGLVIDSKYDRSIKKPYLTPIVRPSVIMSANYGVINVLLVTSTTQKSIKNAETYNQYNGVYSSQQVVGSDSLSVNKKENKQFWIDNPLVLKEKIINGLYDVAQQFADDFNSISEEK